MDTSIKELLPSDWPMNIYEGHCLINDWHGWTQHIVGSGTPAGGPGFYEKKKKKKAEKTSKQCPSMTSVSAPTSRFLL